MSSARLWQLDVLRLLAVSLVLFRHLTPAPVSEAGPWLHQLTLTLAIGGWIGVDLFFVLSGYLVSGLLFVEFQRSGQIKAGRFLLRRGLKIYPPFWLLIAVTLLYGMLSGQSFVWQRVAAELLFIQNYLPGLWPHTWSLAIEEHFYLGLCIAVWVLTSQCWGLRSIPWFCLAICIGCLLLRILTAQQHSYTHAGNLFPTHLRADSLMFGVLLSYLSHFTGALALFREAAVRYLAAALALLGFVPFFLTKLGKADWIHTYGLSLLYLCAGLLMMALLYTQLRPNRLLALLARIGACSYAIYLWHFPIKVWTPDIFSLVIGGQPSWTEFAVIYLSLSLAGGVLITRLLEAPVLKARDRWFPAMQKA